MATKTMSTSEKNKSKTTIAILTFSCVAASLALFVVGYNGIFTTSEITRMANVKSRSLSKTRFEADVPQDIIDAINPQIVDFAVAGFQKCGTTYLQNKILYPSKRVFIPHHETHYLQNDKYKEFVAEFENATKSTDDDEKAVLSGYKSPFELGHQKSLRNLETLFPDIRMIITLRHPILAFESLYNYKLRASPEPLPPVGNYVGICGELCSKGKEEESETMTATKEGQSCVNEEIHWCTGEMNYHKYLSRLGLTPMNTPEEMDLLCHHHMSIHDFSGSRKQTRSVRGESAGKHQRDGAKIFLIEIGQFDSRVNRSMADKVNSDLEKFLGLDFGDLPRAPARPGKERPKIEYGYPPGYEEYVLDICLDRHKLLREVLLESSQKASEWITKYLLHPSNRERVSVSNIDAFEEMMEDWKVDPCLKEDLK